MRIMLLAAVSAAALLYGAAPSEARREGPWCATVSVGWGDMVSDCSYRSIEECRPNVIAGNRGYCTMNPRWQGSYEPGAPAPRKARKRAVQH